MPGQGELAVASALERAAGTFTQMAIEHKQKDDALSYARAKNEYQIASIQEREKLKEDQDFDTHDERYRTAMKGHYERLFPTVNSSRDRLLFDAEARLMDERGSVDVNNTARVGRIGKSLDDFNVFKEQAKGVVLTASDAQTAQDAMFGVIEEATALRDKGYLTPDEYKATLQSWVQDTAFARLRSMDPAEREVLLERSITHRKTTGKPITEDDIKEGLGTGSIADFLPLDTAVAMLETTQKANEIEATLGAAQEIFDTAEANNKTDTGALMDEIRELTKDADPEVREKALALGRQHGVDKRNERIDDVNRVMARGAEGIRNDIDPSTMDRDSLALLSSAQRKALELDWQAHQEGREYGKATMWTDIQAEKSGLGLSYATWRAIPDEQKIAVDLQASDWRMAMTQDVHKSLVDEQNRLRSAAEGSAGPALSTGLTNQQMVTSILVRKGFMPQTDRDLEDSQAYQQVIYTFDRQIQAEQNRLGRNLSNTERNKILAEIMAPMAFTDTDFFMSDYDIDEAVPIAAMSVTQREDARLRWENSEVDMIPSVTPGALPTSYRQELELMATKLNVEPSKHEYERAYFALKYGHQYGMTAADVEARLKGE
jgi:hypothetical protein